jgi:hypothetical protein
VSDALIAIVLFACVTYVIKLIMDARSRRDLLKADTTQEFLRALVAEEADVKRRASLRLSLMLFGIAGGFGIIDYFGWDDITPGAIAVLAGATGLGNLAYFLIARRLG